MSNVSSKGTSAPNEPAITEAEHAADVAGSLAHVDASRLAIATCRRQAERRVRRSLVRLIFSDGQRWRACELRNVANGELRALFEQAASEVTYRHNRSAHPSR